MDVETGLADARRKGSGNARHLPGVKVVLVALLLAISVLPLLGSSLADAAAPKERTIRVEASQFQFDPGVVAVNRGDRVTIELVATDVVHGLYLDGYGLEVTADPGKTAHLTFTADRSGTFRFRCSVSCGAMHPFMIGKLRVGDNMLLWAGVGLAVMAAVAGATLGRKES